MNKPKLIISSAYAAIITISFTVIITVWAELSTPLKDWLKNFSGHHWTSKSILSALLYAIAAIVLYWLSRDPSETRLRKTLIFLAVSAALGVVVLAAFYTGHHFRIF